MGWAHVFVLPPLQKGSFDLLSVDRQTERFNLLVFPLHWPDRAFLSHESCWEHTELFLETQILVKTLKQRESDCRLGWLFRQPVLCVVPASPLGVCHWVRLSLIEAHASPPHFLRI